MLSLASGFMTWAGIGPIADLQCLDLVADRPREVKFSVVPIGFALACCGHRHCAAVTNYLGSGHRPLPATGTGIDAVCIGSGSGRVIDRRAERRSRVMPGIELNERIVQISARR